MRQTFIDITGRVFNRWTVLERAANRKDRNGRTGEAQWLCRCECGTIRICRGAALRNGTHKNCRRCRITHGATRFGKNNAQYSIYSSIKERCFNVNHIHYKDYGGRGITMCEEWRNDYAAFLRDVGPRPQGMTLDRYPNNDGNYEPGNVRWATELEQARNKRNNRLLTYKNKTLCLSEWSERSGIGCSTISARIAHGWSVEKAITVSVNYAERRRTHCPKGHLYEMTRNGMQRECRQCKADYYEAHREEIAARNHRNYLVRKEAAREPTRLENASSIPPIQSIP